MKFLSITLIALVLQSGLGVCQRPKQTPEPVLSKLLMALGPGGEDFSESIYMVGEMSRGLLTDGGDLIIRVCSPLPLSVALANSLLDPLEVVERLHKRHSIPLDRIFFLRYMDRCRGDLARETSEYWYVPPAAQLPEFVEATRATDLKMQRITSEDTWWYKSGIEGIKLTPRHYQQALDDLLQRAKADKRAFVVMMIGAATADLVRNQGRAVQFLRRGGISASRIFTSRGGHRSSRLYPDITLVASAF